MTEFTKTKMHFALALIGALFALHPFLEKLEEQQQLAGLPLPYPLEAYQVRVFHAYAFVTAMLALSVYFYAMVLLSERSSSWSERAGNFSYAVAIMLVPLYGGLYLLHLAARELGLEDRFARSAPWAAIGAGVLLFLVLTVWLRRRLGWL